jgi:hypothetical protein
MAIEIRIDASGAFRKIRRATNLLEPDKILGAIGQRHLAWINQNLRGAGIEDSWPPMSPNTIAARPQRSSGRHFSSRYQAQLQQSFTVVVSSPQVEVGTELQFSRFHHEGTRPTTIRPRSAKMLRFVTAGGVAFAREVHHPGIPARHLVPSARLGEELAVQVLEAIVAQLGQEGPA